ncbi:MAG: SulP family inorganic anion transporter [Vampirovibrionales bacterium]|nr:SulP family inorganic anion transporter [Vampirovibrionales bacterium]
MSLTERFQRFFHVLDNRFEAYHLKQPSQVAGAQVAGAEALGQPVPERWKLLIRDILAGMIVALIAIPLNVGFAIASNMRPEQGIAAGVIASILGAVLGGSKFQVYGPTAAFITIIAGIVSQYDVPFLILATLIAGVLLLFSGMFGLGRFFNIVPHSVIVGFTMGIAVTIMITQLPEAFGVNGPEIAHHTVDRLAQLPDFFAQANGHALVLAILTFFIIRKLYQVSIYIPAPLIAILVGGFIANYVWDDNFMPLLSTKFGDISHHMFALTLPSLGERSPLTLIGPVVSIYFIAALESLLSAKMADRLANNPTPFDPDKEFFGQATVNLIAPVLNGMPCTGALARTAASIKVGAVSPLASFLMGIFTVVAMLFFSSSLSVLPMACIGGLLVYVAMNMVKPDEVRHVRQEGWFHVFIMLFTALMTIATDLMIAVISATVLHYALKPVLDKKTKANG